MVANKPVGACLGGIIGLIYVQQAFPYEDPARYFHNVDRYCGAFGRSDASCRENREYPHLILDTWAPGYRRWLQG